MPKYELFKPLHILSFVEHLHIKYKPGTYGTEACRNLFLLATNESTTRKFPKLKFTYEIANHVCLPEINIVVSPGKSHKFGMGVTMDEIHREIDNDQYLAYVDFMKKNNIEKGLHEED